MSPLPFTEPVAVSALQSAILCPGLFVFRHILRLEELRRSRRVSRRSNGDKKFTKSSPHCIEGRS